MAECTVLSRVEALGLHVSQQQLFPLCVTVTARGLHVYGNIYRPSALWMVPDAAIDLADTVIQEFLGHEKG